MVFRNTIGVCYMSYAIKKKPTIVNIDLTKSRFFVFSPLLKKMDRGGIPKVQYFMEMDVSLIGPHRSIYPY